MEFKRFCISEVNAERYYQLPKFLFEGELKDALSAEAKVLYALLRDRFNLSCKNGWTNEKGEVYLIYTREEMCDMIGCGMQKIRRLIKELKDNRLLEEEHIGQNMPNRLFLTYISVSSDEEPSAGGSNQEANNSDSEKKAENPHKHSECRKSTVRKVAVCKKLKNPKKRNKSGLLKINTPECRKTTANKNNYNKTNYSNNPSILSDNQEEILCNNYSKVLEQTKEQIEYDCLKESFPSAHGNPNIVDSVVELITDIRTSKDAYICIGNTRRPTADFCFKLTRLTGEDIYTLIQRYKSIVTLPQNTRAYLTAMLWNARTESCFS